MTRRLPEVLAPAGGPDCLPAAVAGGADAVYLGLRHFNARGRAENFRKAELPGQVAWLHRHGLKVYVVLNTLVHDDELPKAVDLAWHAWKAGVDAAIIQDLGLWRVLTQAVPGLKRHASTQMTIHHPSQIEVLAGLGAERIVLARELSGDEVRTCTRRAAELGVEIEHFVHGALCYAFSGQCLMSNFAGCRSANRGTCAQNCRFGYTAEGAAEDTVLSMKDLALLGRVGELCDAGVASFKIEGRLKGPDYVYAVSRAYRAAVDAWAAGRTFDAAQGRDLLRTVFARTFTDTPWAGVYDDAARLHRRAPDRDAVPDGHLDRLDRAAGIALVRARRVEPGTGYRFPVGMYTDGFLVIGAERAGEHWRCRVRVAAHGPRPPAGTPLFLNADQRRETEMKAAVARVGMPGAATIAATLIATGAVGGPLRAIATTADGRRAVADSDLPLAPATGRPLDHATVTASLGALGGSGFHLGRLDLHLDGPCFLPAAALKELRRRLVADLAAQPVPGAEPPVWTAPDGSAPRRRTTALWVAVGSLAGADAAFAAGADAVWLDDPALDLWGAAAPDLPRRPGLWLRHPATAPLSPHLAAIGLPVVAGHLGALAAARAAGLPAIADHPCNAYSTATIAALADLGAGSVVLSLECSAREVARLTARLHDTPTGIAVCVHGRVPAMLTRQDHGLETGTVRQIVANAKEGGLPYELQRRHHDTVVWEARRLAAPAAARLTAGLVDAWLLECNDLDPAGVAAVTAAYARLRDGGPAEATDAAIRPFAPAGVFPGHLEIGARELDALEPVEA
jgi:putative protease